MKKVIGLWIDHREAVIVSLCGGKEAISHLYSGSDKHMKYSGSSHSKTPEGLKEVTSEDGRDRKFENILNKFYDEIVTILRGAETIQIFGPGEAKGELVKRIEREKYNAEVLAVETKGKMTSRQISAKVRAYFA